MASTSGDFGSLTAVGRSQPVASLLAPLMRALLALPPAGMVRRGWRSILVGFLACSIAFKGHARLQQMRYSRYMKAQQRLGKHRPEPTWQEILGRQGGHVVAGHIELALVAAMTILGSLVGLYREFLQGKFYIAQNMADKSQWRRLIWLFPATTMASAFIAQVTQTCTAWVALSWRKAVTYKIHELYFDRRVYYHVLNQQAGLGVPDADTRICDDVKEACDSYAGVMSGAVQTLISILMQYGAITSRVAWTNRGWVLVPPFFILCIFPAVLSTVDYGKLWQAGGSVKFSMGALSHALTRAQLHSERVCMLHGEKFESEVVLYHLQGLIDVWKKMTRISLYKDVVESMLWSGLFPSAFQAVSTFTSSCIIASGLLLRSQQAGTQEKLGLRIPRRDVMSDFGGYVQNWWSVAAAAGTLNGFLSTWSSLMEGQAAVQRVSSLFASMQAVRESLPEARPGAFQDRGPVIAFENVAVDTPSGQRLLEQLSLEVNHGDRLLICGHNGSGKSSIIRCLSALWPIKEGVIARPGGDRLDKEEEGEEGCTRQIYYLPQKPCSVIGSLSDQLTYPRRVGGLAEGELRCWLRCVGLEYLVDRDASSVGGLGKEQVGTGAGSEVDWEQLLSLGEQQALAIARLFYHHPRFAILDECTSAVSAPLEQRLFAVARVLGITCITITHRPALQDLHTRMLRLTGHRAVDGKGWELTDLPQHGALPPVGPHAASREEALHRVVEYVQEHAGGADDPQRAHPVSSRTAVARKQPDWAAGQAVPPAEEAQRRWPSSFQRFAALVRMGMGTPGHNARLAMRLALVLVGMRVHCDLLWQAWSAQMGAIAAALSGDMGGILAEAMSYVVISPLISCVDVGIKYYGKLLGCDVAEALSRQLVHKAFSGSNLLGVIRPGSSARLENPLTRIAKVGPHFSEVVSGGLLELMFRCSHGLYSLRTLIRGVGPVAFLSPPTYFAVFRLCLLVAPDFGFLSRREADLETRFQVWHTRLRHFAEPVAFSGGGRSERMAIEPHFDSVINFQLGSLRKKFMYRFVESLFSNHSYIPLYMQRLMSEQFSRRNVAFSPAGVSPEVIVQGFMFERSIMYNETMTHRLGSFMAVWRDWDGTHLRLLELAVALERAEALESSLATGPEEGAIEVQGLDLTVPNGGACLALGLDFTVREGAGLVISGPNACGKSLLASVLLGLFPADGATERPVRMPGIPEGTARPPLRLLSSAPQRIYLPTGNLGDQVCYPTRYDPLSQLEHAMEHALTTAGIGYLREREAAGWLHHCTWEDVLSGGEQQRMGFTRVLYQRPRFAILDECTSMVAHDSEEALYRSLVNDFSITPITLSQRLFMPDIHSWELKLGTNNQEGWSLIGLHTDGQTQATGAAGVETGVEGLDEATVAGIAAPGPDSPSAMEANPQEPVEAAVAEVTAAEVGESTAVECNTAATVAEVTAAEVGESTAVECNTASGESRPPDDSRADGEPEAASAAIGETGVEGPDDVAATETAAAVPGSTTVAGVTVEEPAEGDLLGRSRGGSWLCACRRRAESS